MCAICLRRTGSDLIMLYTCSERYPDPNFPSSAFTTPYHPLEIYTLIVITTCPSIYPHAVSSRNDSLNFISLYEKSSGVSSLKPDPIPQSECFITIHLLLPTFIIVSACIQYNGQKAGLQSLSLNPSSASFDLCVDQTTVIHFSHPLSIRIIHRIILFHVSLQFLPLDWVCNTALFIDVGLGHMTRIGSQNIGREKLLLQGQQARRQEARRQSVSLIQELSKIKGVSAPHVLE